MTKILPLMLALTLGLYARAETEMGTKAQAGADASMAKLNDKQIAKVLMTINEGEIDAAKIAKSKAQNNTVKEYAKMMIADHEQNLKDTKNVAKKADISPESSDACKALKEDAKASNADLKKQDKGSFDKAYITQQVEMHQKALNALNNELIPATQSLDLKAHLEKTRDAVTTHLARAKEIQATL